MGVIIISTQVLREIKNFLDDSSPKKIAAIKALRQAGNLNLRVAKVAIERLQHEEFGGFYPEAAREGKKIITSPRIKKLIVDMGDGDIEVDIENFQMVALQKLQSIGLEQCGEILDLIDILHAFSNGKKVEVVEDSV